jgi:hypothetical protein
MQRAAGLPAIAQLRLRLSAANLKNNGQVSN